MDAQLQALAETAASHLLRQFREEHTDWSDDRTPLDEIVVWLGLSIATFHFADRPYGTYGYMDPDEDEHLIWLRRDLPEPVRRFTLAHELGHALLHCQKNERMYAVLGDLLACFATQESRQHLPKISREDPCHDTDVQEDTAGFLDQEQFQERLGIGQSYDPRSQRELSANIFAAELLMPVERVRIRYLTERMAPQALAECFGVSPSAMLNRLAGLLKHPTELGPDLIQEGKHVQPRVPAKKQYDEFQQAAIEAATPALVVAGPGSGKTSTLIGRIEYIISTLGVRPYNILALTFSRKAAREMEERLQHILNGSHENGILPKVSTFHAFCADLLRQHGTHVGLQRDFALLDEAEGYFLLRQQANAMRLRHYQKLQAPAYYFPDLLKAISRAKDELVTPGQYAQLAQSMKEQAAPGDEEAMQKAERAAEVAHVYALYEQALQQRGDTDFGGLLMLAIRLLREHPDVLHKQQQQYQHILVDEFQDVNRASGVLLHVLAGEERHVWVVGDANQAIYGFRGASPANIRQFETDFPGAVILPLSHNYRSRPDLVNIAETFRCKQLEFGEVPGKNQPVRLTQPETYVTLAKAPDEACEQYGMIRDIQQKRAQGYDYKDMIVLCRTRAQVQKISHALADAGLPVIERSSVLEQEHSKNALSLLLLFTNQSEAGLLRVTRQPEYALAQRDFEALLLAARAHHTAIRTMHLNTEIPMSVSVEGRHALLRLSATLQRLQHAQNVWTLLASYVLFETAQIRNLLSNVDEQHSHAVLADYDALLQLARHYDQQQQKRLQQAEQSSQKQPLEEQIKGFLEYLSLLVLLRQDGASRQQSDEERNEQTNVIRVMTVHASKGLEFPIVYIPGLVQQRFPTTARSSPIIIPTGMLPAEYEGAKAHESGESCLFYVGVTRARDHLILSYSTRYGKKTYKRSPYLDALEAGLAEDRITKLEWIHHVGAPLADVHEVEWGKGFSSEDSAISPLEHPQEVPLLGFGISSQPSEAFINAMKPPTLTASGVEAYQHCPRQYAYSTIYHFSDEKDGYQLFWQATQKTIEALQKHIQEQYSSKEQTDTRSTPATIPFSQEEVQALYTQHWQEIGGHEALFAPLYEEHGQEVLSLIHHELTMRSLQESNPWQMRQSYIVNVAGKEVQVTVDRVTRETVPSQESQPEQAKKRKAPARTAGPAFIRTRFGKRKEKPTAETRELFYALAYRQQYPGQDVTLYNHNMSTGEATPITMTSKKEQSLYEEVEQAIEAMERHEYPARPAEPFRCPTCPFFLICPV